MKIRLAFCVIAISAVALFYASRADAQASRTWVSGVGDDLNPCGRSSPCRTFAGALGKTVEGGEISALDSGDYGPVAIHKAVTINGTGVIASITASADHNGVHVNVNTNASTATVILRNLSINGLNQGHQGISYVAGKSLVVDHCWIHGFTYGISAQLAANGNLKVIDSVIEDISAFGITLNNDPGFQLLATIDRSRILSCDTTGLNVQNYVRVALTNSILTHNAIGIAALGTTDSIINVDRVVISHSSDALMCGGQGSEIRVTDSIIAQNFRAIFGNVHSFQGNSLIGNALTGTFVSTTAKQ